MYDGLQEYCDKAAIMYWQRAWGIYGDSIGKLPPIILNSRLRTTAGNAYLNVKGMGIQPKGERVELNLRMLHKYHVEFKQDTIPHELAHFIAYRVYGSRGHDKHFYGVCEKLGANTSRCHNMVI